jgi:hypothetical protein
MADARAGEVIVYEARAAKSGWTFGWSTRLADNAMVALAPSIAESDAGHEERMVRLVMTLLEDDAP